MARPRMKRTIMNRPIVDGFQPFGTAISDLEPIILLFEEYESIRLSDYECLTQQIAAEKMQISRATFSRIYEEARHHVAQAFVEGRSIFIQGGDYHIDEYLYECQSCKKINASKKPRRACLYCTSDKLKMLNRKIVPK
jgi:predicted DNA-binding protein (UPF0251 family)